jgi:hypothetical protein
VIESSCVIKKLKAEKCAFIQVTRVIHGFAIRVSAYLLSHFSVVKCISIQYTGTVEAVAQVH